MALFECAACGYTEELERSDDPAEVTFYSCPVASNAFMVEVKSDG